MINTPHINPTADISETILLPGDPLRAKFIAENYLENTRQFNSVRSALGFTGEYRKKTVSVLGTGMGMPSMGIYSHELINIYGVKNIIRIGSCGALQNNIKLNDIIIAMAASTNSSFGRQYNLPGTYSPSCSFSLLLDAKTAADSLNIPIHVGNVLTSDIFYNENPKSNLEWAKMGILAVEMETAALYMTAARYGARALSILTVSDSMITNEDLSAAEREQGFRSMMHLALEAC